MKTERRAGDSLSSLGCYWPNCAYFCWAAPSERAVIHKKRSNSCVHLLPESPSSKERMVTMRRQINLIEAGETYHREITTNVFRYNLFLTLPTVPFVLLANHTLTLKPASTS